MGLLDLLIYGTTGVLCNGSTVPMRRSVSVISSHARMLNCCCGYTHQTVNHCCTAGSQGVATGV